MMPTEYTSAALLQLPSKTSGALHGDVNDYTTETDETISAQGGYSGDYSGGGFGGGQGEGQVERGGDDGKVTANNP